MEKVLVYDKLYLSIGNNNVSLSNINKIFDYGLIINKLILDNGVFFGNNLENIINIIIKNNVRVSSLLIVTNGFLYNSRYISLFNRLRQYIDRCNIVLYGNKLLDSFVFCLEDDSNNLNNIKKKNIFLYGQYKKNVNSFKRVLTNNIEYIYDYYKDNNDLLAYISNEYGLFVKNIIIDNNGDVIDDNYNLYGNVMCEDVYNIVYRNGTRYYNLDDINNKLCLKKNKSK